MSFDFEGCKRERTYRKKLALSCLWLSGAGVDTEDEEADDGVYKCAIDSVYIEGGIETQG